MPERQEKRYDMLTVFLMASVAGAGDLLSIFTLLVLAIPLLGIMISAFFFFANFLVVPLLMIWFILQGERSLGVWAVIVAGLGAGLVFPIKAVTVVVATTISNNALLKAVADQAAIGAISAATAGAGGAAAQVATKGGAMAAEGGAAAAGGAGAATAGAGGGMGALGASGATSSISSAAKIGGTAAKEAEGALAGGAARGAASGAAGAEAGEAGALRGGAARGGMGEEAGAPEGRAGAEAEPKVSEEDFGVEPPPIEKLKRDLFQKIPGGPDSKKDEEEEHEDDEDVELDGNGVKLPKAA